MGDTNRSFASSFISGGMAGISAKTVIAPMERIKLLYTTRQRQFQYKEALKDAKFIYTNHGILNFWRGNSANVVRIMPQAAINFSVFDFLRDRFAGSREDKSIIRKVKLFLCGSSAGIVSQTAMYPLDFLRTRMAMQRDQFSYKNLFQAITDIYKKEGAYSFYSGLRVGIIGVAIYHGSGFFFFTVVKEEFIHLNPEHKQRKIVDFSIGAVGAIFAQLLSYPLDVLKKRMQGQRQLFINGEIDKLKGTIGMMKQIYDIEGITKGFYKGITLNMIKGPLASGTAWTVKNVIHRHLDKKYDL